MKMIIRYLFGLAGLLSVSNMCFAEGEQQFADIGDLRLTSGQVLERVKVGYRTFGTLNADRSNVLVYLTWFTGRSVDLRDLGRIGSGKFADTDRYFVIAIDALGNGVSTSPSTVEGGGESFPRLSIKDMVHAQHIVLSEVLGFSKVNTLLGESMGGMQAFQWAVSYPQYLQNVVTLIATPKPSAFDLVQWETHKSIILLMQAHGYKDSEIFSMLAKVTQLTLSTPEYIIESVEPDAVSQFLEDAAEFNAGKLINNHLVQIQAMIDHDIFSGVPEQDSHVRQAMPRVLSITVDGDHMVRAEPTRELMKHWQGEYHHVQSIYGHLAAARDTESFLPLVARFLANDQ